ncbi:kelch repeat-containing protein [Flavobacterium sp.]|uniref:Kelch repeat-containing protein n=1 Tax=Flavobacterium sp. TaxID=239 RepID=UPI00122193B7|nr:kelch repeat-containing protein [Flavobacterium sp.]RZJ72278.1 MAG: galactose oxidase [Flavobacterium sp.]
MLYKKQLLSAFAFLALCLAGCSDDDESIKGNWLVSTVFDGSPRGSAVSFTIGDFAFMGTGYDGDDYLNDFWKYDINGGYWTQVSNFPGTPRSSAVAFAIGTNGYVGTGYDGTNQLGDFYKYDTNSNSWQAIPDFGGTARRAAVAFNSDAYGYVGTGFDGTNDKKDFWKFNPETNTWEELFGFGGNKRREATNFTIGNVVYMGTGASNNINQTDFWSFDLSSETWTRLKDIDDKSSYEIERANATGFTIGNRGYICGGNGHNSTWEYETATDKWTKKTNFEGAFRQDASVIDNGTRGFVLLGKNGNYYYDDMYEFKPDEAYEDED